MERIIDRMQDLNPIYNLYMFSIGIGQAFGHAIILIDSSSPLVMLLRDDFSLSLYKYYLCRTRMAQT